MSLIKQSSGSTATTDLATIIKDGALLVDVRTPAEFATGHVSGSVNIPLDKMPAHLAAFKNQKAIIVFCLSGGRSSVAKSFLDQQGIMNVINGGTWNYVNQFVK